MTQTSMRHVCTDCIACLQVVDNSSAFRMTEGVPLVIPEVNPEAMKGMRYGQGGIIANPNCSTIIALMAVTPLHRAAKVMHTQGQVKLDCTILRLCMYAVLACHA